jgi:hypothetical protein
MDFNEVDLQAVGKIQELKSCTPAKAKEIFRKHAQKLANPDVEDRAQLVLDAIERGAEIASDEEVEETVTKKKASKPNGKANGAAKKEKKAAKPAAAKKSNGKKPSKTSTPRVEHPLAELEREVELTPIPEERGLYTATLFGKKHVTLWVERNRSTGAEARYQAVNVSESQLEAAKKYGKAEDMPVAVCCTIRVLGKLDQGYAVPFALFNSEKAGASSFNLSGAARKAYSEGGWDGCKFSSKAVEKAA